MKVKFHDLGICGVEQLAHAGSIAFNTTGAADGVAIFEIPEKCIITRAVAVVKTAFDAGTTNVLIVGTKDDDDAILAAADITEGTAGTYTKQEFLALEKGDKIYAKYTQTGTAATAGLAEIYLFAVGAPD